MKVYYNCFYTWSMFRTWKENNFFLSSINARTIRYRRLRRAMLHFWFLLAGFLRRRTGFSNCVCGICGGQSKHKLHSRPVHEGPDGEYRSTVSLTCALNTGGWPKPRPSLLNLWIKSGAHFIRICLAKMTGSNGCETSRLSQRFDPQDAEHVAGRYNEWAAPAPRRTKWQ